MEISQPKKEETELAAVRLPKKLRAAARQKAKKEDITFSQLMRRALRKELTTMAAIPFHEPTVIKREGTAE